MGIELKIIKGPNKGKIVILKQKTELLEKNQKILVQPLHGGPPFYINSNEVKRFNLDKKTMTSLQNKDFMFETTGKDSVVYIEDDPDIFNFDDKVLQSKSVNFEVSDTVNFESEKISSEINLPSVEYKPAFNNYEQLQITDVKNLGLTIFEMKIFTILLENYKTMYSGYQNTADIAIFTKNLAKVIDSELIKVADYRLFISVLLYQFIKKGDIKYPDNIDKKLQLEEFIEFLLQKSKKISEDKLKSFLKIIDKNFYSKKEKKSITKKTDKVSDKVTDKVLTKESLIESVKENKSLSEKTKEILIKSIKLFDKKDFSKSLNPLVKQLYKDYKDYQVI